MRWSDRDKRAEMSEPGTIFAIMPEIGFCSWQLTEDYEWIDHLERECAVPCLYVYELQIDPKFQKKGYGRQLMEMGHKAALDAGIHKVKLTVFKQNKAALHFYKQLGYEIDCTDASLHEEYEEGGESVSYHILSRQVYL